MKHLYLKLFVLSALFFAGGNANAYDCEVDGIYYNIINDSTAEVTYNTEYTYTGDITIPQTIIYNGNEYRIKSIGNSAFKNCKDINIIKIPEGVVTIKQSAFSGCSNITNIVPYSTKYGDGTNSVIIPNTIKTIGESAFSVCNGIEFIKLPNGIEQIESRAFRDCYELSYVYIPNSVLEISDEAFYCLNQEYGIRNTIEFESIESLWNIQYYGNFASPLCSYGHLMVNGKYLNDLVIPDSVKSIKVNAFADCHLLSSITLPNSVTSIGGGAFSDYTGIVWFGDNIEDVKLISFRRATNKRPHFYVKSKSKTVLTLVSDESYYNCLYDLDTQEKISLGTEATPTTIRYKSNIDHNPYVLSKSIFIDNVETTFQKGLNPSSSYKITINYQYKFDTQEKAYTLKKEFYEKTSPLTLTTLQPKVASPGNVVVAAESNIDDEETNVGFEWRRTDWTDDFTSNSGGAYLFEGTMEGYIRNLNTEKLWKYRPYYESNSGNRYYGDWVGIDPTNTSYFEPTVHTYAKVSVQGNSAEVKGYAMRGSDNVTSQGFMYWKTSNGARAEAGSNVTVPKDAMTVEAKGNMMTATLEGLDYESTYSYVAFMTTSEGETFYGELQSFQTGEDTSGVETLVTKANDSKTAIYDIRGRRLDAPQRGINIIRMSNGKTQKVFVK